jgi:paraquat-inducible protein B
MMASVSHLKLGILFLAAVVATTAIVFALGLRRAPSDTYHAYFDESVQGLEVGALVKYRGVKIGQVSGFTIAPDGRHVDVELSIERDRAKRVGLEQMSPAVRAQLAILGITGLKIIDLDVVDPAEVPPPVLPFPPKQPYIASHPSLLTGIQRGLQSTTERVPELVDRAISTLERMEAVLDQVHDDRLSQRIAALADSATKAVDSLERALRRFDRVGRRLDGVLVSARRASDALGDAGQATRTSATELGRTIRDLGDAARTVRRFFKALERQPDMLLKGRGRSR